MGQYGGKGGNPWKETFETIKRVRIYHGLWIDSFQIQYEEVDEMGTLVWTEIYGGEGGFLATVSPNLSLCCFFASYSFILSCEEIYK